jgi:cephalosporin hydroxylase
VRTPNVKFIWLSRNLSSETYVFIQPPNSTIGPNQGYDVNLMSVFNTILVIDDGSHFAEDVSQAFAKFSPWVSLNSYYIIEDGVIYFEDPSAYGGWSDVGHGKFTSKSPRIRGGSQMD